MVCRSSRLPDLPPGREFGGTDSIAGEISFVQTREFGLDNLGEALARAGSAFGKLVKLTLMLTDVDEYAGMQSALVAYCREHAPQPIATTFMGVAATEPGGARFQVDAVAVI